MISKDIEQITEENLQALVDNKVSERKTIEYKQALPSNSDKAKKEFLADVSSFANASGGEIIYGIIEEKGIPKLLAGLISDNADQEIQRLDNMVRTGIQPRIPSVNIFPPIPLRNGRFASVVRIAKSWISPHRVIYDSHDKFYSRSSNGKYPLDVSELRTAFNLSETITERIRNFRQERVANIIAGETPVPFYDSAKIVLHLIPIISFNPTQSYDIDRISSQPASMPPIYSGGWEHRYNLDGLLTYSQDQNGKAHSYVQLFRNGIIEALEGILLEPREGKLVIPSIGYEKELIKSLNQYLTILKALDVELPVFIFLTLVGVKGYSMAVSNRFPFAKSQIIDRDILQLPEVIVESYDSAPEKILKPCFDTVWNACGFRRSFNYNDNGEWAPK